MVSVPSECCAYLKRSGGKNSYSCWLRNLCLCVRLNLHVTVCLLQLPGVTENLSVFGPLNVDRLNCWRRNNLTGKPGSLSGPHFQQRRARSLNTEPEKSPFCVLLHTRHLSFKWKINRLLLEQGILAYRGNPSLGSEVGFCWGDPSITNVIGRTVRQMSTSCVKPNFGRSVCSDTTSDIIYDISTLLVMV